MLVAFELSMPNNNSWNGKWSGAERRYVRVLNVGATKKALAKWQAIIDRGQFTYSFGDGWCAMVTVSEVSADAARKLRKASVGFCGYDWMIDSIRYYGEIYGPANQKPSDHNP